jgi:hypothetical protein
MKWLTLEPWSFVIGVVSLLVAVFGSQQLTISNSSGPQIPVLIGIFGLCSLIASLILGRAHLDSRAEANRSSSP